MNLEELYKSADDINDPVLQTQVKMQILMRIYAMRMLIKWLHSSGGNYVENVEKC